MLSQVFLPKVSCVVIANSKRGLLETINSIAIQSYAVSECFVINSSINEENVIDIVENFKIILVDVDSEDENVLIERAVSIASSEFIMVLTSNNRLYNEDVIAHLLSGESDLVDIVYGNMIKIYPNGCAENKIYPDNIKIEDILFNYLDLFPVALFRRNLFLKYKFYQSELKFTSKLLFEIELFFLNVLNIKYKNIAVSYQHVNRSGSINKYSVAHLVAKERDLLIEKYLSHSLKDFLYEKLEIVNYFNNSRTMSIVRKFESVKDYFNNHINFIFNNVTYSLRSLVSAYELKSYKKKHGAEAYNIPIIINNRNHLTYLEKLIHSLEIRGYKNLYVIDNDSNYSLLREYYKTTPYKVFALDSNIGFCALWDTELYDMFENSYYVYTDSDLELIDECPKDFLVVMQYFLTKYQVGKVGLSLPIDDLPDHFINKQEVIAWESQFQRNNLEKFIYKAKVDTTFALYGPGKFGHASMLTSLRIKFPYSARHLPWYENTSQLTSEQVYYYMNAKTSSHWSSKVELSDPKVN